MDKYCKHCGEQIRFSCDSLILNKCSDYNGFDFIVEPCTCIRKCFSSCRERYCKYSPWEKPYCTEIMNRFIKTIIIKGENSDGSRTKRK